MLAFLRKQRDHLTDAAVRVLVLAHSGGLGGIIQADAAAARVVCAHLPEARDQIFN